MKEVNKLASQKEEAKRFNLFFPHRDRMGKVQRTMKLLKSVVWERKIAFEQAQAVLDKQRLQESLQADASKTPEDISKTLSSAFPRPIEDVGRDTTSRFRLQDRYKGAATERRKRAERVAKKNPRTFIL